MKHWTIEQLKMYIVAKGGRVDDPNKKLKHKDYRKLLLSTARRLASKNESQRT